MATNTSALISDRASRLRSVQEFNIRTLKTLNYHGGNITTPALALIHGYTKAGVRKRMNSMVKLGWIEKIEHDEGLGRSEQIWCITKAGRLAAQTENDLPIEDSELKGFEICNYSPALSSHTKMVQVMANRLSAKLGLEEIKPFKIEVSENGKSNFICADIIFNRGLHKYGNQDASIYDLYEVELTVKPLKYYQDFLLRVALHNAVSLKQKEGYVVGAVTIITTPELINTLEDLVSRVRSNVDTHVVNYMDVIDEDTDKLVLHSISTQPISFKELQLKADIDLTLTEEL